MCSGSALMDAINYIEKKLFEGLSVGGAADAAHYSLFHFIRLFNEVIGLTPYEYIMRRRLSEAVVLLADDVSVTEIAYQVGFDSLDGFSRSFRRMFGITPSEYRQGIALKAFVVMPIHGTYLSFLLAFRDRSPKGYSMTEQFWMPLENSQEGILRGRLLSLPSPTQWASGQVHLHPSMLGILHKDMPCYQSCIPIPATSGCVFGLPGTFAAFDIASFVRYLLTTWATKIGPQQITGQLLLLNSEVVNTIYVPLQPK